MKPYYCSKEVRIIDYFMLVIVFIKFCNKPWPSTWELTIDRYYCFFLTFLHQLTLFCPHHASSPGGSRTRPPWSPSSASSASCPPRNWSNRNNWRQGTLKVKWKNKKITLSFHQWWTSISLFPPSGQPLPSPEVQSFPRSCPPLIANDYTIVWLPVLPFSFISAWISSLVFSLGFPAIWHVILLAT